MVCGAGSCRASIPECQHGYVFGNFKTRQSISTPPPEFGSGAIQKEVNPKITQTERGKENGKVGNPPSRLRSQKKKSLPCRNYRLLIINIFTTKASVHQFWPPNTTVLSHVHTILKCRLLNVRKASPFGRTGGRRGLRVPNIRGRS